MVFQCRTGLSIFCVSKRFFGTKPNHEHHENMPCCTYIFIMYHYFSNIFKLLYSVKMCNVNNTYCYMYVNIKI